MAEIRSELNQTGFNGTVLAPHNDAITSFLSGLGNITLAQLQDGFPTVLRQTVEQHILPFNFTVDDLTKPGNGLGGQGNNRDRIEHPGRPGRVGSPGNGDNGPGNGGGAPGIGNPVSAHCGGVYAWTELCGGNGPQLD